LSGRSTICLEKLSEISEIAKLLPYRQNQIGCHFLYLTVYENKVITSGSAPNAGQLKLYTLAYTNTNPNTNPNPNPNPISTKPNPNPSLTLCAIVDVAPAAANTT